MSDVLQPAQTADPVESLQLANVIAEITDRLQAGEPVDIEAFLARCPEHADDLRRLLPALALVDALKESGGDARSAGEATPGDEVLGTLGDFRIIREVGRGGMGVVYEAEQVSLHRRVALKVLPFAGTLDPRQLQRFQNEAQAAACLHHSNIVPVFFVGCDRGVHHYAMQFIDGQTLAEGIRELQQAEPTAGTEPVAQQATLLPGSTARGRDHFRRVAELGVQAAEALDHAHQAGVVHRDVKPANLMVDSRGNLWVTDFGLARIQSEASITQTGHLVGTLRYMSPEQALAKRAVIDHRTDIYSLGATLYELITLRPAFTGVDRQELLRQIAFEEPPPLRRLERGIPAELEVIVLKAMEKDAQDRYATAQELADDLRRWLEDRPIQARAPRWRQRLVKWCRRHPAIVGSAAVAMVLTLVILSVSVAVIWQQKQQTEQALGGEQQALTRERQALRREKTTAYLLRISLADLEGKAGQLRRSEGILDECPPDVRQWEWHHLKGLYRPQFEVPGGAAAVAFSGDGQHLALVGPSPAVTVWDVTTRTKVSDFAFQAMSRNSVVGRPVFSRDGRCVAGIAREKESWNIEIWDVTTGELLVTLPATEIRGPFNVAFSHDGQRIAAAFFGVGVKVWDIATRKEAFTVEAGSNPRVCPGGWFIAGQTAVGLKIWSVDTGQEVFSDSKRREDPVVVSPDGRLVAMAAGDGSTDIVEVSSRKLKYQLKGAPLAFSPDGIRLACGDLEGFTIWDIASRLQLFTRRDAAFLAFSPDGKRLACGEREGFTICDMASQLELFTLHDGEFLTFSPDGVRLAGRARDGIGVWDVSRGVLQLGTAVQGLALSPDGLHVAAGSLEGKVIISDVATGQKIRTLVHDRQGAVNCAAYSPAGHLLASAGNDRTLKLWDSETGELVATLQGHAGEVYSVAFSPDGTFLATGSKDHTIKLWDATTCEELRSFRGHTSSVAGLGFSSDGRRLVSATGLEPRLHGTPHELKVWDVATGQELLALPTQPGGGVNSVAFSPDGQHILAAPFDGLVKVWDATTGEEVRFGELPVRGGVLAFSPDGQRLATKIDSGVKLWDAQTGQEILTLGAPKLDAVLNLSFSLDGTRLAAGDLKGTVVIWDGTPGEERSRNPSNPAPQTQEPK
jgi:WD40 repeat protein/serine/threonine protein kinase